MYKEKVVIYRYRRKSEKGRERERGREREKEEGEREENRRRTSVVRKEGQQNIERSPKKKECETERWRRNANTETLLQ